MIRKPSQVKSDPRSLECLQHEQTSLQSIGRESKQCKELVASEAHWNCAVQYPMLKLALVDQDVRCQDQNVTSTERGPIAEFVASNVTTARIIPRFVPLRGQDQVKSRVVDFTLNMKPTEDEMAAIIGILRREPAGTASINQTLYTPQLFHPTMMSIETKLEQDVEEAKVQLGIWTSAWHSRIRSLIKPSGIGDGEATAPEKIISVPVAVVTPRDWRIFFACDRVTHTDIIEFPMPLGAGTTALFDLYVLLAALRRTIKWGQERFAPWIRANVLGLGKKQQTLDP